MFLLDSNRRTILDCRKRSVFLAFFWMLGCFFGSFVADGFLQIVKHGAVVYSLNKVTLFSMFILLSIPFFFSLIAAFLRIRLLVYGVAFCDAAAYSVVAASLIALMPVGGWLISCFLLFSKNLILILQFSFLRLCLLAEIRTVFSQFIFSCVIVLLIVLFDWLFVAPFLLEFTTRI